jgi:hypothetical protein
MVGKKNSIASIFLSLSTAISFCIQSASAQRAVSALDWPEITNQTRPWTRWWWHGSIAEKRDLTVEMEKYVKAGLGGVEITPIYGVKGQEDRFIQYLSPAWMELLEHSLKEASRLGMGVDMATGTGWPFGGPQVGDADSSKYFAHKTFSLKGGQRLDEPVGFTQRPVVRAVGRRVDIGELKDPIGENRNLQALALDQVRFENPLPLQLLMAYSNKGEVLDLTARAGSGGKLDWTAPDGEWTLYAIFEGQHGKMVERAAPGGEGYVIDHFSSPALKNYLSVFDRAFAGRDIRSLRAFFNDSYEVDDADGEANWTPNFLAEFQRRRGYDLRLHLHALFGKDSPEKNSRVLCDFRETISDLLLDEFTIPWRQWAAGKGKIVRNQSHGSPANILDLYAASDIPETEGQEILRMKFATSAAHVSGKMLASSESATWLDEHFQSSLGDVKRAADKFFLGGVNHIFYHGTPFSPQSEEWPGRLFYASVHFGPTNSFWTDFSTLNRYIARCQSFLQSGKPDNDVLLYYPIHDNWSQPSRSFLQHYGGGIESALGVSDGQTLMDAGYSFDMISDRQVAGLRAEGGSLLTGGAAYKALVVPETKVIPSKTFEKLLELARSGATVIVRGKLPADVPGLGNLEARRNELKKQIVQISFADSGNGDVRRAKVGRGRFLLGGELKRLMESAGVRREPMVDRGLRFTRRSHDSGTHYFIANQSDKPMDGWVALAAGARAAAIFDPMSEARGLATTRRSSNGAFEIYLQLAPGESRIVRTFSATVRGESFAYFKPKGEPRPIDGSWIVSFVEGGPELPQAVTIGALGSWTNFGGEALKSFSGTARYAINFDAPASGDWLLDLGRVADSARVKLNGRDLGTLIDSPWRIRIPKGLMRGKNTLEVEVSNLIANRIADLDRRKANWKKFYNINFPARRRENAGPDGLFSAANWTPRESGLIGPVTIAPIELQTGNKK